MATGGADGVARVPITRVATQQFVRLRDRVEARLEAERDQLPLWLPVALGAGVAAWFVLPDARAWGAVLAACGAAAGVALALGAGGRASRLLLIGAVAVALGLALVWWQAERRSAPVLAGPAIVDLTGRVERVEPLAARDLVRVTLAPQGRSDLPPRVRVNLATADAPAGLTTGAVVKLGARLMPPAAPAVPGAYDFARVAWFQGLGATGRGFAPVEILTPGAKESNLRSRLSAHIRERLPGSAGGIAAALATGDQGGVGEEDAEAMRRSGLAHLLSVSGLHITAVVAAVMLVVLRLLALSPGLALNWRLPLVAAGAGALAAVGYTLLTGAEVPTIRSCVAALLVLVALALGREAITLRLVAAGAVVVLLFWPEALAGPSFQLSFAAVTAIVALHEHPAMRCWFGPREAGWFERAWRGLASLLLTGLVVEIALIPIGLYHFHKAGVYGALANIVAIPLTTFVVMPAEALALLLDAVGLGAPLWWVTGHALDLLLWIARSTAGAPGAVAALPGMPGGAYALTVAGGLWLALWRTRWRRLGLVPIAAGMLWALTTPPPDLLVTGDGRHLAVRTATRDLAILRDRAGDYTRSLLSENGGSADAPLLLAEQADARCNRDACLTRAGAWTVLATRSPYMIDVRTLATACAGVDIVVSDRRLPRSCRPRWLKLDRPALARTGGVAIAGRAVHTVRAAGDLHPWRHPPTVTPNGSARLSRPRAAAGDASAGAAGSPPGSGS